VLWNGGGEAGKTTDQGEAMSTTTLAQAERIIDAIIERGTAN
jgi:hypothetical protein